MQFATIITESHVGYALALAESISCQVSDADKVQLHCLVVDSDEQQEACQISANTIVRFYRLADVRGGVYFDVIFQKYHGTDFDAFRWSMKPVFVACLLKDCSPDSLAFVDPDQFFVGDPTVLFEQLDRSRFLLSPHDRPIDPSVEGMFTDNFTDGIFNGGLFVCRADAEDILEWWASVCAHRCEVRRELGCFVDQKYLDAVLTNFHSTDWIRHRGANVASWNMHTRRRQLLDHGAIRIDDQPLICVHFSGSTIRMIDYGIDPNLAPALKLYREVLAKHGINLPFNEKPKSRKHERILPPVQSSTRSWGIRSVARYLKRWLRGPIGNLARTTDRQARDANSPDDQDSSS
ncbi:hypothetical protein FHS27_002086 [Rhodopirellula rubra]|uniref:Glycosyl transferase n=1 Tax=Aporhodopirellula rubra TaxID=980271 RepID=A0A7W5DY16_9BACT|nr:hypothetical protein [Aporhodopirellula rubra]MBB3206277.1 hypothetical protein [Aporhodopirellula rubra]